MTIAALAMSLFALALSVASLVRSERRHRRTRALVRHARKDPRG